MTKWKDKPYSQVCENNKASILKVLLHAFKEKKRVLEVGSGSGQHAVFFASNLPHLHWHTSDVEDYHEGINQWIDEYPSSNLSRPLTLKLARDKWLSECPNGNPFDAIFSANTAHIMQKHEVELFMQSVNDSLPKSGVFCQYGPFIVDGKFTSQSNADFHERLLENGRGGYRDIDELRAWAPELVLSDIIEMPANNLMLCWNKTK